MEVLMAETMPLSGAFVGIRSRPYDMTDREGGRKGISRKAWFVTGDEEPTEVSFDDNENGAALFEAMCKCAQFAHLDLVVRLGAAGNKITRKVESFTPATSSASAK